MATMLVQIVFMWFVLVSDAGIIEKLVLAVLCAFVALAPLAAERTRLLSAIAQGGIGVYICLRMTYLRAKAGT